MIKGKAEPSVRAANYCLLPRNLINFEQLCFDVSWFIASLEKFQVKVKTENGKYGFVIETSGSFSGK